MIAEHLSSIIVWLQALEYISDPSALSALEQKLQISSSTAIGSSSSSSPAHMAASRQNSSAQDVVAGREVINEEDVIRRLEELLRKELDQNVIRKWIDVSTVERN